MTTTNILYFMVVCALLVCIIISERSYKAMLEVAERSVKITEELIEEDKQLKEYIRLQAECIESSHVYVSIAEELNEIYKQLLYKAANRELTETDFTTIKQIIEYINNTESTK